MRFAAQHAREFARVHWPLLLWFTTTSLVRIATTVAAILLIRDFLTSVLSQPSGVAGQLTTAVGQTAALWVVVGLLLTVFLTGALSAYGGQLAMQRLMRSLELELMQKVIAHLLQLPVAFFDRRHRGDIVESVRLDVSKTRTAATAIIEIGVYGAQALAYTGSALVLSPRLMLVSLPVLCLTALPAKWFGGRARRRSFRVRKHGYRITDLLLQLVQGIRIVKVYSGEAAETRNSIAKARRYFDELIAASRIKALGDVVLETAAGLSVVVVIVVGGFEVIGGRLTLPSLVALLVAIRAAHGPVANCFGRFMEIQANWASFERFRQLLHTPSEPEDPPDAVLLSEPVTSIEFSHVSFAYGAEPNVLTDVSFDVRAGQRVGIVGPSGVGKTTLMSLVARFYDPVEGRILLNGRDLREYRRSDLRRHLAIVTQDLFVFGTSVRENIRYGRIDASDAEVERAAMAAEIHHDVVNLPEGYDTIIGVGGRLLSAGQIQRVNIARALLKNAQIVILDEATSNLDSISETKIQAALERLIQRRTTFIVAHRLSTIRNADLIVVIEKGRCVAVGSHDMLLLGCHLYRRLWEAQAAHVPAGVGPS
jgi:ATP-binding cassette, subfamily B, bacterial MsbA